MNRISNHGLTPEQFWAKLDADRQRGPKPVSPARRDIRLTKAAIAAAKGLITRIEKCAKSTAHERQLAEARRIESALKQELRQFELIERAESRAGAQ